MLDVHPPHHPTHTWKDFFIHIATITVGLLIAVGLEQTVELAHHHHQREDLERQMHEESEANLGLVRAQIDFGQQTVGYYESCLRALNEAPAAGGVYAVTIPVSHVELPADAQGMLISPSRGTWTVAKASGTVALLPAETAKIYARLDLSAEFELEAEKQDTNNDSLLLAALDRAHARPGAPSHLTAAQRDDLMAAYSRSRNDYRTFVFRLAVLRGALRAVVDGVPTLQDMYPYQGRSTDDAFAFPSSPITRPTHEQKGK